MKKQKKKLNLEAFAEKAKGQILTKPATKAVKGGEGAQVEFIVEEDLVVF